MGGEDDVESLLLDEVGCEDVVEVGGEGRRGGRGEELEGCECLLFDRDEEAEVVVGGEKGVELSKELLRSCSGEIVSVGWGRKQWQTRGSLT